MAKESRLGHSNTVKMLPETSMHQNSEKGLLRWSPQNILVVVVHLLEWTDKVLSHPNLHASLCHTDVAKCNSYGTGHMSA